MNTPGAEADLPLLLTVLVASLVGSLHCAGMCGVFVAMAVGAGDKVSRVKLQTLYHGGRLVGYSILGVVAGAVGQAVDLGASAVGLNHAAAVFAAVTVITIALASGAKELGWKLPHVPTPGIAQKAFASGARTAQRLGTPGRALVIGLLTALLPCGWLYAFALVAAGTASPLLGGLVMAAFWVGTVPILALVGFGAGSIRQRLGAKARVAAAVLVAALGASVLLRGFDADLSGVRTAMQASDDTGGAPDVSKAADAPCPLCTTHEK